MIMPSPQMQEVINRLRQRRETPSSQPPQTYEEILGPYSLADQVNPLPADVSVTDLNSDGVPAHWLHIPNAGDGRVLMFVHGGGYSLGSLRSDGELAAQIGRAAEMHVFFPEYRLAPEHLFPAAFDDVLASWQWLRGVRGVAAESVVLAGDSAGSGLTLALLQTLRDAGDSLPAGAVLISPLLDLTASGASIIERADEDLVFTPDLIKSMAPTYLGDADPKTPAASPLFGSMAGLPPLLVQVGSAELLLSDSERLASAAAEAGVDITLHVGEGLPHVYQAAVATPEAVSAMRQIADFIRRL
jgi:epsilon-lactone hydrolase